MVLLVGFAVLVICIHNEHAFNDSRKPPTQLTTWCSRTAEHVPEDPTKQAVWSVSMNRLPPISSVSKNISRPHTYPLHRRITIAPGHRWCTLGIGVIAAAPWVGSRHQCVERRISHYRAGCRKPLFMLVLDSGGCITTAVGGCIVLSREAASREVVVAVCDFVLPPTHVGYGCSCCRASAVSVAARHTHFLFFPFFVNFESWWNFPNIFPIRIGLV